MYPLTCLPPLVIAEKEVPRCNYGLANVLYYLLGMSEISGDTRTQIHKKRCKGDVIRKKCTEAKRHTSTIDIKCLSSTFDPTEYNSKRDVFNPRNLPSWGDDVVWDKRLAKRCPNGSSIPSAD